MLVTIPAVIYISFICWSYGSLLFHLLTKVTRSPEVLTQSFPVTCFAGLAVIGTIFSGVSLISPASDIMWQIILFLPTIYWTFRKREVIASAWTHTRIALARQPLAILALLFSCLFLVLIMHSGTINHPDTLTYHAQLIEWTKNYPAVPGLAHLNVNYGSQSTWFVLCALFSFSFTGTSALTFVNAAVIIWFVLFVVLQINIAYKKEKGLLESFLWLLLLIVSLSGFTQLRLTANSASPDFIAAISIWLVFYLFTRQQKTAALTALLFFLSLFSMTIKLSALPCVLIAGYAWLSFPSMKAVVRIALPVCVGLLVFVPWFAKNIITTGYLLYPSPFPDWFNVDWKVPKETVLTFQDYISTYARTHVAYDKTEIISVLNMNISQWLPTWWKLWSWTDKILLLCIPVFFVISLLFPARVFAQKNRVLLIALIFSFIGIVFWFLQAPDPRFGLGFIIPFCALAIYLPLHDSNRKAILTGRVLFFWILATGVTVLSYSTYRITKHLAAKDFIQPAGVAKTPFTTINCKGVDINIPVKGMECGDTPVPCTTKDCKDFMPRGTDAKQGFSSGYDPIIQ